MSISSQQLSQEEISSWTQARQATPRYINFGKMPFKKQLPSGKLIDAGHPTDRRPRTPEGKLLTPKQIRARARRRAEAARKGKPRGLQAVTEQEFEALYKPIEEWDMQELAKGRPRDVNGGFAGKTPSWITREVHERAMERFKELVKMEMGSMTPSALDTIKGIMANDREDDRGKPQVPASTKLQAAQFLIEHAVGKPTQRTETDISVKLQAVLAAVMVNPNDALAPPSQGGRLGITAGDEPAYQLAHTPGHTIPLGADEPIDADWFEEAEG